MSTALYRRYRPETFAEVIGQEHVTGPLTAALSKDRINHAYLFSGPRGCGKTTSARILARCLNCAEGPTATPCGVCDSCRDLARGGPGSLDVVEIDAASHGGVDDARSLRERAVFAPARDRFKVFIIDEAHMVSTQGFNALLKIVEEPPPHIRFVFATTEPDKVIGTIRSRTHHYPFRLVPPERLQNYLGELCTAEGVDVGQGVLPLVVRAGAGSVRDSLSVLDQLIAGAGPDGLTYSLAVSLLGYTDATLLDDVVDALAVGDGATVFQVVDRVIESGHDPRRFVEDLLERLRDLLVVAAVPDGGHAVLRALPADQLRRMQEQAGRFGRAELSRAADVVNTALTEMTGATSPRLQLELLCARLLLPAAEESERGLRARVDRIEKRLGVVVPGQPLASPVPDVAPAGRSDAAEPVGRVARDADDVPAGGSQARMPQGFRDSMRGAPAGRAAAPADPSTDGGHDASTARTGTPAASAAGGPARTDEPRSGEPSAAASEPDGWGAPGDPEPTAASLPRPTSQQPTAHQPSSPGPSSAGASSAGASDPGHGASAPTPGGPVAPSQPAAPAAPAARSGGPDTATVRRLWPDVLTALSGLKRATWSLVSQHAQVVDYDGTRLMLGFGSPGLANTFGRGAHSEFLRQALIDVVGLDCTIEAVAGDRGSIRAPQASTAPSAPATQPSPQQGGRPQQDPAPHDAGPPASTDPRTDDGPGQDPVRPEPVATPSAGTHAQEPAADESVSRGPASDASSQPAPAEEPAGWGAAGSSRPQPEPAEEPAGWGSAGPSRPQPAAAEEPEGWGATGGSTARAEDAPGGSASGPERAARAVHVVPDPPAEDPAAEGPVTDERSGAARGAGQGRDDAPGSPEGRGRDARGGDGHRPGGHGPGATTGPRGGTGGPDGPPQEVDIRDGHPSRGRRLSVVPPVDDDIPLPDEPPPDDDFEPPPDDGRRSGPSRSQAPQGRGGAGGGRGGTGPGAGNGDGGNGAGRSSAGQSRGGQNGSGAKGSGGGDRAPRGAAAARAALHTHDRASGADRPGGRPEVAVHTAPKDDEVSFDDADIEDSSLVGAPVVEQLLGGKLIDEREE